MKSKKGITLIALIITIISMLILAGVSLNAIIGDNGIITNAQLANVESKFASYKEELGINLVASVTEGKIEKEEEVTLLGENVRKYIPSLADEDIGKFNVISGKLYYTGEDELEKKAALSQNMETDLGTGSKEELAEKLENLAVDSVLKNAGKNAFNYTDEKGEKHQGGIPLYDKTLVNASKWKVVTEVEEGVVTHTYGTGWTYIPKGTEVENLGTTTCSYIGNYATGEIKKFDEKIHSLMGFDSSVAVTDHLIFNADPRSYG